MHSAPFAIFRQVNFSVNAFFVLFVAGSVIVRPLTLGTVESY